VNAGHRAVRRVETGSGEPAVVLEARPSGSRPENGSCRCWPSGGRTWLQAGLARRPREDTTSLPVAPAMTSPGTGPTSWPAPSSRQPPGPRGSHPGTGQRLMTLRLSLRCHSGRRSADHASRRTSSQHPAPSSTTAYKGHDHQFGPGRPRKALDGLDGGKRVARDQLGRELAELCPAAVPMTIGSTNRPPASVATAAALCRMMAPIPSPIRPVRAR
jgi:hypothetical protein